MATLTLAKRPVVGKHRGYLTHARDVEALEHLRYKLIYMTSPTPGAGKHRATR